MFIISLARIVLVGGTPMKGLYWKIIWILITILALVAASGAPSSFCGTTC